MQDVHLVRAHGLVHLSKELRSHSRFLGRDVVEVHHAERDAAVALLGEVVAGPRSGERALRHRQDASPGVDGVCIVMVVMCLHVREGGPAHGDGHVRRSGGLDDVEALAPAEVVEDAMAPLEQNGVPGPRDHR